MMSRASPKIAIFLLLFDPEMENKPVAVTEVSVSIVSMLWGSIREVIIGAVPNLQSAQRLNGLRSSQELTKQRYIQLSWR